MHRLFAVTFGYLRFTALSLISSTVLLFLVALAIKSPLMCAVIIAITLSVLGAVYNERWHIARIRAKKGNTDTFTDFMRALPQAIALASAANVLLPETSIAGEGPLVLDGVWITIWTCADPDPTNTPGTTKKERERSLMKVAVERLKRHKTELLKAGIMPLFADFTPEVLEHITWLPPADTVSLHSKETISLAFLITSPGPSFPVETISAILGSRFVLIAKTATVARRSSRS